MSETAEVLEILKRGHWSASVMDNRPKRGWRGIPIKGKFPSRSAALAAAEAAIDNGRPAIDIFIHGPTARAVAAFTLSYDDTNALGLLADMLK